MGNWNQWSEESTEQLKALWKTGLSASRIACRIRGTTRNGILGKVHRLHLERRAPSPGGRPPQTREERNAKARAVNAIHRLAVKQLMNGHGAPVPRHIVRKIVPHALTAHPEPPKPSLAPINGKARHMKPRLWKARHASPVSAPAYAGEPKLITELLAGRGCRYAVTDDKPFRFCGAPGYPWCEFHSAVVWRPL